jgi:copper homeostasis protein (lipoprotein)
MLMALLLALAGCATTSEPQTTEARTITRYFVPGAFAGTLPCGDCSGVDTQLHLLDGGVYFLRETYRGRDGDPLHDIGRYLITSDGEQLSLHGGREAPVRYVISGPDTLALLDRDGGRIASELNHTLVRQAELPMLEPRLFMAGKYSYLAGAGRFQECLTGLEMQVAPEAENRLLEEAYLSRRDEPGQSLLVSLEGQVVQRMPAEGKGPLPTLIPERFVGIWPGLDCPAQVSAAALEGTHWRLVLMSASEKERRPDEAEAHLVFLDGKVSGSDGCNRLMGHYLLDGSAIEFSSLASTRMSCPRGTTQGEAFRLSLERASRLRIIGKQLEIRDEDEVLMLRFEADQLRPAALSSGSLANATYPSLMREGAPVTLADGRLQDPEHGITYTLLADHFADGTIEGAPVAAVLLAESGGGSGTFINLVLFGIERNQPVALAATMLGDRPRVKDLAIDDDGAVAVHLVQVGARDKFCCPATPMSIRYVYQDGQLRLRDLWSASIEIAGYANQANAFVSPATRYDRSEPPAGQGEPAHFAWTFDDNLELDLARVHAPGAGYVAVYPVAPYLATWADAGDSHVADTVAALKALLDQQPGDPPAPLPWLPLQDSVNDFAARVAYLELPDGGRGVRFIGRFAQDAAPLRNDQLRYLFQGFSADGTVFVVASLPITTGRLPDDNVIVVLDPASPAHDVEAHFDYWRGMLNGLQPSDFEPSLEKLDALLRSLTVTTNP